MIPIHLLEACVYIAARRLDYCTQEVVLSQRAAGCDLHNCKTRRVFTGIELEFVLRHPGGVDLTVTERFVFLDSKLSRSCILLAPQLTLTIT